VAERFRAFRDNAGAIPWWASVCLVVVCAASCAPQPSRTEAPTPSPSSRATPRVLAGVTSTPSYRDPPASAGAAGSVASLPTQLATSPKPTAPIELSLEIERVDGRRSLVLVIPEHGRITLREVPEPVVCHVIEAGGERRYPRRAWLVGCELEQKPIWIGDDQGRLLAGSAPPIPLEPERPLRLDVVIRGQGPMPACASDAPSVTLDARVVLRESPLVKAPPKELEEETEREPEERRVAWFEVPTLGIEERLFGVPRPERCDSERVRNRLLQFCVSQECSSRFEAVVRDGVLGVSETHPCHEGTLVSAVGAVRLPCGAKVRWRGFRKRDPEWQGVGIGLCNAACQERRTDCEDRCRTMHPNDYEDSGEPQTDGGQKCLDTCEAASQKCRCPMFG
jgi:hypothetical protein